MVTRFAPSPTGHLHLGHAYAAKVAYELAQEHGGEFLVRFEDIDHTRTRPEYYESIEADLRWLGYDFATPALCQMDRLSAYQNGLETLKSLGVLYPCVCTRKDIERELSEMTAAPHSAEGPLYPKTCKGHDSATLIANSSESPAWRLDTEKAAQLVGPLTFHDQTHGTVGVDPHLLGDLVLARKDIGTSYHLAVTIDDAYQGITHVTRGDDLLSATHIHRLLQALLGLPEPAYLHHPLVLDAEGERLAKRNQPLSLKAFREENQKPEELFENLRLS